MTGDTSGQAAIRAVHAWSTPVERTEGHDGMGPLGHGPDDTAHCGSHSEARDRLPTKRAKSY